MARKHLILYSNTFHGHIESIKSPEQISMKMPNLVDPPNWDTQTPWYKFKLNQNLNLMLNREILRSPSLKIRKQHLFPDVSETRSRNTREKPIAVYNARRHLLGTSFMRFQSSKWWRNRVSTRQKRMYLPHLNSTQIECKYLVQCHFGSQQLKDLESE